MKLAKQDDVLPRRPDHHNRSCWAIHVGMTANPPEGNRAGTEVQGSLWRGVCFGARRSTPYSVGAFPIQKGSPHRGRWPREYPVVEIKSGDEMGMLERAFNAMAEEVKHKQDKLHRQANFDALTGLPNDDGVRAL